MAAHLGTVSTFFPEPHRQTDKTASPMPERCGPNGFGVFLSGPGCVCWPFRHQSRLERNCRAGRRANSCEVSRMVRQGARKRSVAGCQGWEHTEPCLKPGHAPSTGAERGWVKGYKKGGVGQSRKEGMQTRREEQIVQTIINPVFVLD